MVRIQWYYGRTGPGQVAEIASYTTPVQAKLEAEAMSIGRKASNILNTEPKVRTGESFVMVSQGDLDWYVELYDTGDGDSAAAGIEKRFGVLARSV